MPTTAYRSAAVFCACLVQLAGCGTDTASMENPSYAGAGAAGGTGGLGGNLGNPGGNAGAVTGGMGGMTGGASGSTGGTSGVAAMMAMTGGMGGSGGAMATGGSGGSGGMMAATGGSSGGGGMMAMTGGSGGTSGGNPADELDEVRQVCVDTINMYRATLGLEPLGRATPEQEMCSDNGAKMDADSGQAHGSAGMCDLGSQNTCPGYPVGGWAGATLADSLKRCLQQMWDEGEPPVSRSECEADYRGCFLQHGHYLNMSDPRATVVGCGFYDMGDDTWWMNQNFALDWRR